MRGMDWMCVNDEERQLLHDLGLTINWNSITELEWQHMLNRNEQSKQLEQLENKLNKLNEE